MAISSSELCAAVIALELRSCRLAEQPEHEASECLLRQGYLFDIRGAADRTVWDVGVVFDGDGRTSVRGGDGGGILIVVRHLHIAVYAIWEIAFD